MISNDQPDMNFKLYFYYFTLYNIKKFAEFTCRIKISMLTESIENAYNRSQEEPSEYLDFIELQEMALGQCEMHLAIINEKTNREIYNYFANQNFSSFNSLLSLFEDTCYRSIAEEFSKYNGKEIYSITNFEDISNERMVEQYIRRDVTYYKTCQFNKLFYCRSERMLVIMTPEYGTPYKNHKTLDEIVDETEWHTYGIRSAIRVPNSFWDNTIERVRPKCSYLHSMEWFIRDCYTSKYYNKHYQSKRKLCDKSLSIYENIYRYKFNVMRD